MREPVKVAVSKLIHARASEIHRVLSDYLVEHPRIVPRPFFEDIIVEEGGRGAGTVYRAVMRVLGSRVTLRMFVTEPQPGRVIQEEDPDAGVITTFTMTPVGSGACTEVEIATIWAPKPGFRGWFERIMNPRITLPVYHEELQLLGRYLAHA